MDIEKLIDVESVQESPVIHGDKVIFIYRGKAESVFFAGDHNNWELDDKMKKLKDKDVWYTVKRFPANSRFDYKYIVDGNWITDPLNKNMTPGGSGYNSTLVMPRYKSNYDSIIVQDVPRGTVIHNLEYYSSHLQVNMRYHLYIPFGYEKGGASHILYALDGSDYLNFSSVNLVFDYLMHRGEIPPAIVVLADPHERTKEYTLYEPYYNYIIHELMPTVENEYFQPSADLHRAAMGVSWGGLTAIYLAVGTQGLFSRVLSQSGSFWPKDWLIFDMIREADVSHIQICLQAGTIQDTEEMNDVMHELLVIKGCQVEYMKYAESHSWGNWKGHLDEGLRVLYSDPS